MEFIKSFIIPLQMVQPDPEIACFVLISNIKRKISKISMCFQGKDLIISYHQLLGIPGKIQLLY